MSYYQRHLFFCCHQHDSDKPCCASHDAAAMFHYAKERVAELGLKGKGQVRVSKSGCMGRCKRGPVAVVYPDAIWYQWQTREDVEEILTSHLRDGAPVERLRLPD